MIRSYFRGLCANRDGSVLIEFALLSPLLITMMLGVVQAGLWMQSYNALRSAANDTGRYVTVQYQKSNRISNIDIAVWARSRATSSPYMLQNSGVTTYVDNAAVQSIDNVTEKTLKYEYQMPTVLDFAGLPGIKVVYSRPLFVKTSI